MTTRQEDFTEEVGAALETALGKENVIRNVKLSTSTRSDGADSEVMDDLALEKRMHKLRKKLDDGQIDEVEKMNEDQLRDRISLCETNILESEKAKEADEELRDLKAKVKEMNASYADVKKMQRALAEYCACLLDKMGVA